MSEGQLWFSDAPSFDAPATDGADYRAYLWPIWTVAASGEVGNEVHLSGKEARQQLENRFHQDFRTVDDALRPAGEVAVGVLTPLLLPPTSVGFGLGRPGRTGTPKASRQSRRPTLSGWLGGRANRGACTAAPRQQVRPARAASLHDAHPRAKSLIWLQSNSSKA